VDAIIMIDSSGVIDQVNPAVERMFGYTASELVGKNVSILMPPPDAGLHDGYLERYAATGRRGIIGIGREGSGASPGSSGTSRSGSGSTAR
jgi:PAS domain S-box-containing protein